MANVTSLLLLASTALRDLITWCNRNVGFLSAVLTFVYVLATISLVLLGYLQLRAAFRLERSRTRPLVILDLVSEHTFVHVTIKNYGSTTARDVRVVTEPEIRTLHGGQDSHPAQRRDEPIAFITNGIAMMPPQREIKSAVGYWPRFMEHYPKLQFSGHISYSGPGGTSYNEQFTIDLTAETGVMHLARHGLHEIAEDVRELRKQADRIGSGFYKPLVRIIKEDVYRRREKKAVERQMRLAEKRGLIKKRGSELPEKDKLGS